MARREEWAREEPHANPSAVQSNAGCRRHASPPVLAPSGEELWQQEGRMPHCLKEGALFLISIPRALSPERNKALAPHWTEHMASLPLSRGTLQWLRPWGREAVTKGGEGLEEKGAHSPPAERCSRLCIITSRGSGSRDSLFQNKAR